METIKKLHDIRWVAISIFIALVVAAAPVPGIRAYAATSAATFEADTGMLSITGSCSGRFVLLLIKNASDNSIWGSSNPPCTNGAYSFSIAVPDSIRNGNTFMVKAMDNGIAASGSGPAQPVILAPDPDVGQTEASPATFSITLDTSTPAAAPDDVSFLADILQNCFGVVVSAVNAAEASVVAAMQVFAKIFTIIPGGSITVPSGQDQISGQGTLQATMTDVFIPNTAVASSSQVIVTPTSQSQLPLAVMKITGGSGFDVGTISPQQIPVSFTWLIINTYAANSSGTTQSQNSAEQSVSVALPPPQVTPSVNGSSDAGPTPDVSLPPDQTDNSSTDDISTDASGTDLTADPSSGEDGSTIDVASSTSPDISADGTIDAASTTDPAAALGAPSDNEATSTDDSDAADATGTTQ